MALLKLGSMTKRSEVPNERRESQRFKLRVPLTVMREGREVSAYTRDMSNRGVFFYLAMVDRGLLESDFEFVIEFTPDSNFWRCYLLRLCCRWSRVAAT